MPVYLKLRREIMNDSLRMGAAFAFAFGYDVVEICHVL